MKKLLTSCLAVVMLITLLGGCGEKTEKPAETGQTQQTSEKGNKETGAAEKIKLKMTIFGSDNDEAVYRQRLDLVQKKYENIEVELLYIPSEYATKVKTMFVSGEAPDILQLSEDVHSYSALGQIMALDDLVSKNGLDLGKRFGTAHQTYVYKDHLYALPDRGGAMIVYYNKDLFDKAGVSYPTKDWTWKDMLAAAQKLTVRNGEEVETYGFAAGDWWPWWLSFIYQNGGRILDKDGKVVFNSPETVEALQFYNDLVFKHKVAPSPQEYADMGNPGPDPLFAQGKVAFEITGFWNIGSLNNVPDLNYDIAPLWHQKESGTTAFGSGLAISQNCKYPEVAYQVIDFLTSVEGQMPIVEMKQDAPVNIELLSSEKFLSAQFASRAIDMNVFSESADQIMDLPLGPYWNEMTEICGNHLSELFNGQKEAAEVAENIQADLEEMMKRYK